MKPIQVYRPSSVGFFVYAFFAATLLLAMILLFYATFSGNFKIASNTQPLLFSSMGILSLLFVAVFFVLIKHLQKPKFSLFDKGIKVDNQALIPFEAISDVYLFLSGRYWGNGYNNLAFRIAENTNWYIISAKYTGNLAYFLDQYLQKRSSFVQQGLEQNQTINFCYIPQKRTTIWNIGAASFVKNIATAHLQMNKTTLIIQNKPWHYESLKPLFLNKDVFEIRTNDSEVLLSFRDNDMMSFEVFRQIYNQFTCT